ncbi:metallophosphoesterase [Methylobacter sp.]|uniref:metallophosphoesterase n=1 Tax=Methylobacter sp. TaxID=2051955 RepID=UPI003DA1DAA3
MKINYFSDVHLECGALEAPANDADIIVASGDIGIRTQGLEWLKSLNKPVIYVAGNHEFYGQDYQETLQTLREQCRRTNVQFLENSEFLFQDVRFLGCTMWADLFVEGEEKADALGRTLNDFKKITLTGKPFDSTDFTQLHQISKEWLERELALPFPGKTVVVTHHAPSQWSWDDPLNDLKKLAYCNNFDLKPLMYEYEIDAWFHGHVHSPSDYRIAGARILCNPRGYSGKKTVPGFDLNRTVVI